MTLATMSTDSDDRFLATAATVTNTGGATPRITDVLPTLGRYEILEFVGAGGMGVVYRGRDPSLNRSIALKLVSVQDQRFDGAARLLREARALALVHHPNVVPIYDVGITGEQVYLVMPFLAGGTLRSWLRAAPRTWRSVVERYVAAGRGVCAAHAANLVHRDFKPDNVLLDAAERVCVADFGLAQPGLAVEDAGDGEAVRDARVTNPLRFAGTPRYMAPEQLAGGVVDARCDQFAFGVALWEALFDEHPFGISSGDREVSSEELVRRIAAGPNPPRRRDVPPKLVVSIRRALAAAPDDRWPTLAAMLDVVAGFVRSRRRWLWIGLGASAIVATSLAVPLIATRSDSDPCRDVELSIDAVWNAERREAIQRALGDAASPIIALFDERTARWKTARRDACQASLVAHDPQTLDERDARYACLERSLIDQGAALAVLTSRTDPRSLGRARDVALGGEQPWACTRARAVETLKNGRPPKRDDAFAAEIAAVVARRLAGHDAEFIAAQGTLEPRVLASNDGELIAVWFSHVGNAYRMFGNETEAKKALRRAAEAAGLAHRDDLAAEAWSSLAIATASTGGIESAGNLLVVARGAALRSGQPWTLVAVELAEAWVAQQQGDYETALEKCKHVRDAHVEGRAFEREGLGCLITAQIARGDGDNAVATGRQLAEVTAHDGDGNQTNTEALLAEALALRGDVAAASKHWARAEAGVERLYGGDSVEMMNLLRDLANAETPEGAITTPQALAAIRRAAAIAEKRLAATDPGRAVILETLASVEGALEHRDAAIDANERAIEIYERLDDSLALARALHNTAVDLWHSNRCARALPLFRRAAKVAASSGQKSKFEAGAEFGIGACLGSERQWQEAEVALRSSIASFDKLGITVFAAQSRWELAEQLIKRSRRADALALANEAAKQLVGKPPPAEAMRAQIVAWIAKH